MPTFTGSFISITPIAPSTLTSFTSGSLAAAYIWRFISVSIWAMRHFMSCALSRRNDAIAIAQAIGLAMNVGPCIITPASPRDMVSATSLVVSTALIVMYPAVSPLPIHMISGVTPACSHAKQRPVRQNPVAISSNMRYMPSLSQMRRSSRRYCGW